MSATIVNGAKLYWELSGSTGNPLVLVHGSWVDHHNWDAVVPFLSQTFRVLAYDRRGHSQSERTSLPGSVQEDAADLAGLIEALQLGPAHILGSSMGGTIVLQLAGERPELFRSLIVHEPPLFGLLAGMPDWRDMGLTVRQKLSAVVEQLEAGNIEGGVRQFVETIVFGPGAWAQMPEEIRKTAIFNAPTFLDEMRDPEAFSINLQLLRGVSCPVLLTMGENSPPFLSPVIDQVAYVLSQAERKIFPGAGHEPEQSHPQEFAATVMEFITQVIRSVGTPHVR